jgi:hypothetical protein
MRFVVDKVALEHVFLFSFAIFHANHYSTITPNSFIISPEIWASPDQAKNYHILSFTPQPLYPRGKSPRYPFDWRLSRSQNRSGRYGEEKICWDSNSDPSIVQPIANRYTDCTISCQILTLLQLNCWPHWSVALIRKSVNFIVIYIHLCVCIMEVLRHDV